MKGLELRTWYPLRPTCKRLPRAGGLYVLRCSVNGKLYVGKSVDLQRRAYKHCRPEHFNSLISRAVLAHGADAFEIMVWCLGEDEPMLLADEIVLIAQLSSRAPVGYNLTAGGEGSRGYRHSPEVLARISASLTGKKRDPALVAATAAANRGLVRSAETLEKMRQANLGRKYPPEFGAKMSALMKGRVLAPGVQEKMTNSLRKSAAVRANIEGISIRRQRRVLMWPPGSMVAIEFASVKEAGEFFGKQRSDISNYCRGAQPRSGHQFAYLE